MLQVRWRSRAGFNYADVRDGWRYRGSVAVSSQDGFRVRAIPAVGYAIDPTGTCAWIPLPGATTIEEAKAIVTAQLQMLGRLAG